MKLIVALLLFTSGLCTANASPPPEKTLRFAILAPFAEYEFYEPVKKGVADAARSLGVNAIFTGTRDGNVHALAEMLRQSVKDGYDGIAVSMTDPLAFDDAVAEAIKLGVPVISFNVDDNRTPNARLASIGQNMLQAGRKFGKVVESFIPKGSHVLLTMHDQHISALEDRAAGAKQTLKAKGIVWTSLITGTEPSAAMGKIRAALEANPDIKIILGTGSADTEAAGRVIEKYFPVNRYQSAGFDLSPEILRLIKAHVIRLTVDQQPYAQGYYSVLELTLLRRYGLAPPSIDTGAVIIGPDSAGQVLALCQEHYR